MIAESFLALLEGKLIIHTLNKSSFQESFFTPDAAFDDGNPDPTGDDGGPPYLDFRIANYTVDVCPYCKQDIPERGGLFHDELSDTWIARCCDKEIRFRPKNRSPQERQFFAQLKVSIKPTEQDDTTTEISSEASDEGVELQPV